MSTEYHLMLKQDLTQKGANGVTMHTLYELYDIQLSVEPDPKLFDVSKQFTVYRTRRRGERPTPQSEVEQTPVPRTSSL